MDYEIRVSRQTVIEESATIYLEADNEEDAKQLALEFVKNDDDRECLNGIDWEPLSRNPGKAAVDSLDEISHI